MQQTHIQKNDPRRWSYEAGSDERPTDKKTSINRFFMTLFANESIETVKCCQEYFDIALRSVSCMGQVRI